MSTPSGTPRRRPLLGLLGLLAGVAACGPSARGQGGHPTTLTEPAARSAFVAVVPGATPDRALAWLVAATARPGENLDILWPGPQPTVLVAAASPPPAKIVIPGKPAAPGTGSTSYQRATYQKNLEHWRGEITAGNQFVAARTRAEMTAWANSLELPAKLGRLHGAGGYPVSLAGECAIAASALAGLGQAVTGSFGGRRVILLYASNLDGIPPAGELTGDDVVVVTSFLPSASAAAAAQVSLLAADAAAASVLGPEATAVQLAQLISTDLGQAAITETRSAAALFTNDSATLLPPAVGVLTPLVAPLREGATAVINGYASTPGNSRANYVLSYARAAAVAGFFKARGIPASSLIVVGHGATSLVGPGFSGANRRVVVVIEKP